MNRWNIPITEMETTKSITENNGGEKRINFANLLAHYSIMTQTFVAFANEYMQHSDSN